MTKGNAIGAGGRLDAGAHTAILPYHSTLRWTTMFGEEYRINALFRRHGRIKGILFIAVIPKYRAGSAPVIPALF